MVGMVSLPRNSRAVPRGCPVTMPAWLLLAAALAEPFRVERLTVEGDVVSVVAADLDGDGKKDLLATYTTGLPPYQKRFLAIFWNRNGVFAPRPDLSLPVSEQEPAPSALGPLGGGPAGPLAPAPAGAPPHAFP